MDYRERPDPVPPTQDERTFAMLAHLLACFGGGFIAPLIILLAKKDSRFVKFHAIQALVMSVALFAVFFGGFFITMIVTVSTGMARTPGSLRGPPVAFLLMFPLFGLSMMAWVVTSIVLGVRANEGRWSALPGIGRLTRKLMGSDDR